MTLATTSTACRSVDPPVGRRGRPTSLVRQYWTDVDKPGVGPKCLYCSHRSQSRLFRAPPATRHTLICKKAPQHVKDSLRRLTNNKYSRRPPLSPQSPHPTQPHKLLHKHKSLPHQLQIPPSKHQHNYRHYHQQQPLPASLLQPIRSTPPSLVHSHSRSHFHPYTHTHDTHSHSRHSAHSAHIHSSSPHQSSSPVNSNTTLPSHPPFHLKPAAHIPPTSTASPTTAPSMLLDQPHTDPPSEPPYLRPTTPPPLPTTDHSLHHAHVTLTSAIMETLFTPTSRKIHGLVPTPAELRAALADRRLRDSAKLKRQRDEARVKANRLHDALSALVNSGSSLPEGTRPNDPESDDSAAGIRTSSHSPSRLRTSPPPAPPISHPHLDRYEKPNTQTQRRSQTQAEPDMDPMSSPRSRRRTVPHPEARRLDD